MHTQDPLSCPYQTAFLRSTICRMQGLDMVEKQLGMHSEPGQTLIPVFDLNQHGSSQTRRRADAAVW